jgi:hypothetical protein
MGHLNKDQIVITGTSATDTTAYSSRVFNGYLDTVVLTTSTGSTGVLSSTGVLLLRGERSTSSTIAVPVGTTPWTVYPRMSAHTSSGGVISALSTGAYPTYQFPLCEERLVVMTSGGSSGSNYNYVVKVIVGGA